MFCYRKFEISFHLYFYPPFPPHYWVILKQIVDIVDGPELGSSGCNIAGELPPILVLCHIISSVFQYVYVCIRQKLFNKHTHT